MIKNSQHEYECRATESKSPENKSTPQSVVNELAQSRKCIRIWNYWIFTLNKYIPKQHVSLSLFLHLVMSEMKEANKRNSFHILIRYSCVTIIMIHNHKNKRYFLRFLVFQSSFEGWHREAEEKWLKKCLIFLSASLPCFPLFSAGF